VMVDGERGDVVAAPTHGEHTQSVLSELGYTEEEIRELEAAPAA